MNSFRIASVGILYPILGKAVAEGFFHDFSGWFIFMVSLGILLLEMRVLKKVFPDPQPPSPKGYGGPEISQISADSTEKDEEKKVTIQHLPAQADSKFNIKDLFSPPQFVVAVILLTVTFGLSQGIEFREKIPMNKSFFTFPLKIGEWSGRSDTMEQRIVETLDLSDYVMIDYKNEAGKYVSFYVAYYESQRKGESIHSPETCLPGSGWVFRDTGKGTISAAAGNNKMMAVNRAIMQKGDYKQLVYFWFPMRDRILTNIYEMKIYNFWDALTRQRTDGALVRLITVVYPDEEVEDAEVRLNGFAKEIVPILEEYLPR